MNGLINILKPTGMTSHDVVNVIRKKFKIKKVGHTGTLDPNAAGVLPILIGKASKLSDFYLKQNKEYRCQMRFGIATDTKDSFGKIVSVDEKLDYIDTDKIKNTLEQFKGTIKQIPPIYSAIKVDGKKLYKLARKGISNIDIPEKEVEIFDLECIKYEFPYLTFDCKCSSGTYIRTLVDDIAKSLNTKAYMTVLIRTRSGDFLIKNSVNIDCVQKENIIDVDDLNLKFRSIYLSSEEVINFINGKKLYPIPKNEIKFNEDGLEFFKVYDQDKKLLSISYINKDIGILKNKILFKEAK